MNQSANSDLDTQVDEIVSDLLGERHYHKCVSHMGDDCVNCRGTGYDQSPCPICDVDGIAFKNIKQAKQALAQLIADEKRKAEIHGRIEAMKKAKNDVDYAERWSLDYGEIKANMGETIMILEAQLQKGETE